MKKVASMFVVSLLVSFAYAQTPPAPPQTTAPAQTSPPAAQPAGQSLPELLGWMFGEWDGEGVSRDQTLIGKLSVVPELDSTALIIRRESASKEGAVGGRKELIVVGYEGVTKKIVAALYDNKNVILLYLGELKTNEIVFSGAQLQPGYVSRFSFRQLPDGGLSYVKEESAPGKQPSKLEINFKKKS